MADQRLILALDTANLGKSLDLEEIVVAGVTVQRERHRLGGLGPLELADIKNADATRALYGLVTRPIKSQSTLYRYVGLLNAGQVVKNAPGSLRSVWAMNLNGAGLTRYLKLYDKATAATNGDTPIATIPLIPSLPTPLTFDEAALAAGLSCRATTGILDADNGAPAANEIIVVVETI